MHTCVHVHTHSYKLAHPLIQTHTNVCTLIRRRTTLFITGKNSSFQSSAEAHGGLMYSQAYSDFIFYAWAFLETASFFRICKMSWIWDKGAFSI